MAHLTKQNVEMAVEKVKEAYGCNALTAITKMQEAAHKAGDEKSLDVLCELKSEIISEMWG
ncbi:MAG: hypothetical protein [Caudoviricetes sp.]|nr:MAG: hypothetical protein [Caudoviricetes sp.]